MTRDEAIATVETIWGGGRKAATHQIDTLAALGLLTLDEPKTPEDRFWDALSAGSNGSTWVGLTRGGLQHVLNDANLKLVEK
jgi:hypothetical protein